MFKTKHRKNSKSCKGQAAVEFLTTYAWAFVVIGITVGALYYFGLFDFGKYLPQKCSFPTQFKCIDFSLRPTEVRVKLLNDIGEKITVTSAQITNSATSPISCTPPAVPFTWDDSTQKEVIFTSCSSGGYISNERATLKFTLSYYAVNTPSQPLHTINGNVNGRVTT